MTEQAGSCADPPSPVWHGVEQLESRLLLSVAPGSIQFVPADELALSGPLVQPAQAGPLSKLTTPLAALFAEHQAWARGRGIAGFVPGNPLVRVSGGSVVIDAVASGDAAALLADLEALGLEGAASSGPVVSGRFPLTALDELAALDSLNFASAAMALANVGATTSQGDVAMRADEARSAFGVDGAGVTVGVLSDSFDTSGNGSYAADQQSGDLPPGVQVLSEYAGGTDEGRALMQLVHDVAPGAELAFHTAFNGMADFADGIVRLAQAGADVIVDDVIYFAEPMFQDGIIAQAVDTVVEGGVWNSEPIAGGAAYFSSAGNQALRGYESPYVNSSEMLIVSDIPRGYLHDFDPGPGVDYQQSILLPDGAGITVSLQWDQPFASVGGAGASSNLDIYLVATDSIFGPAVVAEGITANIGGDAVEMVQFVNTWPTIYGTSYDLLITHYDGPEAVQMKYVWFPIVVSGASVLEYNTYDGSLYGHANAAGAEAVGAVFYGDTPEYGVDPPVMEWYTSAGPTLILFDTDGNRLGDEDGDGLPGITRKKPGIVAPDGTNTTFFGTDTDNDGFPNFYGTSAAAPHAAAVAALMLHANPSLTPDQTYAALEATAVNMSPRFGHPEEPDGFDFDTGYGLVDALAAVGAVTTPDTTPPTVAVNSPNGGEDWVVGSVHDINWSASDNVAVSSVDLHYSADGGASFVEIATGQVNDGLYGWTVPDDASTNAYVRVTAHDAAGNSAADLSDGAFTMSAVVAVDDYAIAETTVAGTVSAGSYLSTYDSDNVYEAVTERESGGKPSRRHSYLEHKWEFSISGGTAVTFFVEAHRPDNGSGDNFVFEYSTNDTDYYPLLTVDFATDQVSSAALPDTTSGTVYIRVRDTDRTSGERVLDTVYVDRMYIRTESGGPSLPTVTVEATDATAAETEGGQAADTGTFTVRRTGDLGEPLTVFYAAGGTADGGSDYTVLSGSATLPGGSASVDILVTPVDDSDPEGSETVILTLTADPVYRIGPPASATVTILDNEQADVVVTQVVPDTMAPGESRVVAVHGSNFQEGATVDLGTRIVVRSVTFISDSELLVKVKVHPRASEGSRTVTVTNPDGSSGQLVDGFHVSSTPGASATGGGLLARPFRPQPADVDVLDMISALFGSELLRPSA